MKITVYVCRDCVHWPLTPKLQVEEGPVCVGATAAALSL